MNVYPLLFFRINFTELYFFGVNWLSRNLFDAQGPYFLTLVDGLKPSAVQNSTAGAF